MMRSLKGVTGQQLNAICPYFTMFPLAFPLRILGRHAKPGDRVLDPFCGRGTTNFAAKLVNLPSMGIDSSPVAHAITAAKLVSPPIDDMQRELTAILAAGDPGSVPGGRFWKLAYHPAVLRKLCALRAALLLDCAGPARVALRGVALGALHGPLQRMPGYLSNQAPRTYAPKPGYAVRYWSDHGLEPPAVDFEDVLLRRARRFYGDHGNVGGTAHLADSRNQGVFLGLRPADHFSWVITSPPYYGMKTYIADQWLRSWFLGASDRVDYGTNGQITHRDPSAFANDLRTVWSNVRTVSHDRARMVVRFGGIRDRRVEPIQLIRESLSESGWRVSATRTAGDARAGKRQADTFLSQSSKPLVEYDVWARAA